MSEVLVPLERWPRWVRNFESRHGGAAYDVVGGGLCGSAADGSWFRAVPPLDLRHEGPPEEFVETCTVTGAWGLLLVRKGGFAVARLDGPQVVDSKVGQRHVQGRTKAGGQSQQRFARRRANQARAAYEAAADHAARVLGGVRTVVVGGDHGAVEAVLEDPRLGRCGVVGPFLAVPDPRRAVLEQAVVDALSVRVDVHNAS